MTGYSVKYLGPFGRYPARYKVTNLRSGISKVVDARPYTDSQHAVEDVTHVKVERIGSHKGIVYYAGTP